LWLRGYEISSPVETTFIFVVVVTMTDVTARLAAMLESSAYPPELRAKALELLAQTDSQDERRRAEETARAENLRLERTKIWLNTPIIAAIAGLLTLGATQVLTMMQNKEAATLANTYTQKLEERKFQFEMIKAALNTETDPKRRAINLLFLVDSNILDGLNTGALKKYAQDSGDKTPAFISGSGPARPGIERENRTQVPRELIADLTARAANARTLNWMQHAIAELGVTRIPGPDNNSRIMEYARFVGLQATWNNFDEDVPWQGLFVNFVLKKAGYDQFPSSPLAARAWKEWGVELDKPKFGALAVFWRISPASPTGLVGFVVEEDESSISILSGNQNDAVGIAKVPRSQLLGLRMPPTK
jgi:uncharacterized protein (TIGR02594 family)